VIHAIFEDWMFAAGYYLTLFFWTSAFVIPDFLPRRRSAQPAFVRSAAHNAAASDSRAAVFTNQDAFIH
jgi:hypothetical protein